MKIARLLSSLTLIAVVASPALALADGAKPGYVERRIDQGAFVIFLDDPMDGANLGVVGSVITAPKAAARAMLIRPRVQFVDELFRSVERL